MDVDKDLNKDVDGVDSKKWAPQPGATVRRLGIDFIGSVYKDIEHVWGTP